MRGKKNCFCSQVWDVHMEWILYICGKDKRFWPLYKMWQMINFFFSLVYSWPLPPLFFLASRRKPFVFNSSSRWRFYTGNCMKILGVSVLAIAYCPLLLLRFLWDGLRICSFIVLFGLCLQTISNPHQCNPNNPQKLLHYLLEKAIWHAVCYWQLESNTQRSPKQIPERKGVKANKNTPF